MESAADSDAESCFELSWEELHACTVCSNSPMQEGEEGEHAASPWLAPAQPSTHRRRWGRESTAQLHECVCACMSVWG